MEAKESNLTIEDNDLELGRIDFVNKYYKILSSFNLKEIIDCAEQTLPKEMNEKMDDFLTKNRIKNYINEIDDIKSNIEICFREHISKIDELITEYEKNNESEKVYKLKCFKEFIDFLFKNEIKTLEKISSKVLGELDNLNKMSESEILKCYTNIKNKLNKDVTKMIKFLYKELNDRRHTVNDRISFISLAKSIAESTKKPSSFISDEIASVNLFFDELLEKFNLRKKEYILSLEASKGFYLRSDHIYKNNFDQESDKIISFVDRTLNTDIYNEYRYKDFKFKYIGIHKDCMDVYKNNFLSIYTHKAKCIDEINSLKSIQVLVIEKNKENPEEILKDPLFDGISYEGIKSGDIKVDWDKIGSVKFDFKTLTISLKEDTFGKVNFSINFSKMDPCGMHELFLRIKDAVDTKKYKKEEIAEEEEKNTSDFEDDFTIIPTSSFKTKRNRDRIRDDNDIIKENEKRILTAGDIMKSRANSVKENLKTKTYLDIDN